jgi:hypothetical protein
MILRLFFPNHMSNHYHFPSAECSLGEGSSVPACTPGNRTPRHVQWASEVDEDNRIRGHGSEGASDVTSTHELDEAGLDVTNLYSILGLPYLLMFTASRLSNTYPCSRASSLQLCTNSSIYPCSFQYVPNVAIIYAFLSRVIYAGFSKTSRNRNKCTWWGIHRTP